MWNILPWAIVVVIVAAGVVSCVPTEQEPTPVEFTTIAEGYQSTVTESESVVISDVATWEAIWDSLVAHFLQRPPPPEIDFGDYILLAHFMGQKPTGGYEVEFIEVLEGDEISVTVREVSPAPECILAQVTTMPYQVIQIPKTDKEVKFTVEQDIQPCPPLATWLDWPMFHHDPQRTGEAEAAGIITDSTTLQWSYGPVGAIASSPLVDDYGTIYFGSSDGKLYALNLDGTLKFSTQLTAAGVHIHSSPGLSGSGSLYPGRVYIGTLEQAGDNFFAVADDGSVKWPLQVPVGTPSAIKGLSSPLVVTDPINCEPVIYVGAADGFLYCIRDHGSWGEVIWGTQLQPPDDFWGFRSSAAMSPVAPSNQLGTIYCGGQDGGGKLFALDPYNGVIIDSMVLTTNPVNWASSPSVTVINGVETIFAGTCDPQQMTGQMCAVKKVGTALQLAAPNYPANSMILACPAIYDLNGDGKVEVIFGDMGGTVYAVTYDPAGAGFDTYWTYVTGSTEIGAGAAVALAPQPTVFVGASSYDHSTPGGTIYSIKWDGALLGSFTTPVPEQFVTTSPAVAQEITELYGAPGWVFVGSWDNLSSFAYGKLYAFGPEVPAIEAE